MFEHEARQLLSFLQLTTDFGSELLLEEAGGGVWAVVQKTGAGTTVFVGEIDGVRMLHYELNGWENGDEPVWMNLLAGDEVDF